MEKTHAFKRAYYLVDSILSMYSMIARSTILACGIIVSSDLDFSKLTVASSSVKVTLFFILPLLFFIIHDKYCICNSNMIQYKYGKGVRGMSLKGREKAFAKRFNGNVKGFVYSRGYVYSDSSMWIKCTDCDKELKRSGGFLRKVIRGERKVVCNHCTGRKETVIEKVARECRNCGISFRGTTHYCTRECWRKGGNNRLEYKKRDSYNTLVQAGGYDATITLEKLYNEFNGTCYICGEYCSWEDKKITTEGHFIAGESYPSIDHIVPLSKGGTHTWDNVSLVHYRCNVNKSDKLESDEQMGLPL